MTTLDQLIEEQIDSIWKLDGKSRLSSDDFREIIKWVSLATIEAVRIDGDIPFAIMVNGMPYYSGATPEKLIQQDKIDRFLGKEKPDEQ